MNNEKNDYNDKYCVVFFVILILIGNFKSKLKFQRDCSTAKSGQTQRKSIEYSWQNHKHNIQSAVDI